MARKLDPFERLAIPAMEAIATELERLEPELSRLGVGFEYHPFYVISLQGRGRSRIEVGQETRPGTRILTERPFIMVSDGRHPMERQYEKKFWLRKDGTFDTERIIDLAVSIARRRS
jgi:hypothetical protein